MEESTFLFFYIKILNFCYLELFFKYMKKIMKEIDAAVEPDEITEAMEKETDLPSVVNKGLQSNEDFYKMAFQFQEIMMIYESAIKQLET